MVTNRSSGARVVAVLVVMAAVPACNAVLGIEDRAFDPCQTYCDTLETACTGDFQQYQNEATCLAACKLIEVGDFEAPAGDTLACRYKNALEAESTGEPDEHCSLAGFAGIAPNGTKDCVQDRCNTYCDFMTRVCSGSSSAIGNDFEECLTDCGRTPDNPMWGPVDVDVKDHDNSIQCRIWHLSVATTAVSHCAHAEGVIKCDGVVP